jgi:hypothetical protein
VERTGRKVYLDPKEIFALTTERIAAYGDRDETYRRCLAYYFNLNEPGEATVRAMDSTGVPLLRQVGDAWGQANARSIDNRMTPIVDDFQSILGRVPKKRVDPPDGTDAGKTKAEKLTKLLMSTDDLCHMVLQQAEAGFFLSALGDVCYTIDVEHELRRAVIATHNPLFCYPSFKRGWERFELYDLIRCTVEDPEDLKRDYGYEPKNESASETLLIVYDSPWQKSVLIGVEGEGPKWVVSHMKHDLGFCMARWHYNKFTRGQQGTSDIAGVLALQDFFNTALNIAGDGLVEMTYPVRMIKNPIGEDNQIEVGPGATIQVDEMGDIKTEAPTPPPQAAFMLIEHATQAMMTNVGQAPVRQEGQLHGSIQTGKAIHAAQGPQATRVDLRQSLLGYTHSRLYAMLLQAQELAPFLKNQEIEIHGRDLHGREFRESMNTKEIDGWYQVTVSWEQLLGISRPARVQMAMEGMAAKIWSQSYGMDIAGVEDPLQMQQEIESDERRQIKMQAEMQQQMQAGQPGGQGQPPQPGGMQPKPQVPGVSFGNQGSAGAGGGSRPPAPIFRPQQAAPPTPPSGLPQGVTLAAVENALRAVADKLQGTVWVVGDLARTGQSMKPEIRISNWRDMNRVKQALATVAPQASIRAEPSEQALPADAQRVA